MSLLFNKIDREQSTASSGNNSAEFELPLIDTELIKQNSWGSEIETGDSSDFAADKKKELFSSIVEWLAERGVTAGNPLDIEEAHYRQSRNKIQSEIQQQMSSSGEQAPANNKKSTLKLRLPTLNLTIRTSTCL